MTLLSRRFAPAVLAVAFGAMAGAHAQDAGKVQVRVDPAAVVVRNGQAHARDARSGRLEPVQVRRDRHGRLVYVRVVSRPPRFDPYRDGVAFDDRYRPPARQVRCSSSGNCTVTYFDPYYRALFGGGRRGRGDHGDRDRPAGRDHDRRHDDGDRRQRAARDGD